MVHIVYSISVTNDHILHTSFLGDDGEAFAVTLRERAGRDRVGDPCLGRLKP
jgi:hypothetical protein